MSLMIRCLLAPHVPAAARSLGIARTLGEPAVAAPAGAATAHRAAVDATAPGARGDAVATPAASGPAAVAITFDDGPHPEGTPRVLEILAAHGARATFFLVGEQVERRPELAARIVAEGHRVGLHGYRHRAHPRLGARTLERDFERGLEAIAGAAGVTPRVHRPPYGLYSPDSLRIARERGLAPLLWSRWGKDWRKFTTPGRIAGRVLDSVAAGDVILLHDADFYSARRSYLHTVAALPEILTTLESAELGTVNWD